MAEFQTFNLGQVLQTAEALKGARRQSNLDRLQEQYLGKRIEQADQDLASNRRIQETTLGKEKAQALYTRAQYVLQAQNPKNFVEQNFPEFVKDAQSKGIDWMSLDDNAVKQLAQGIAAKAGAEIGQMPESEDPKLALERDKFQQDQTQFDARLKFDREKLAADQANAGTPKDRYRPVSPQEMQAYGLPSGSSAQINIDTGKVDVISRRDNSGALSQKDATVAKQKLNTVQLAKKQLQEIKNAFTQGRQGFNAFGPGQGLLPTEAGKLFDARVNQMRSTLTALTRVPGVGAMSDYETKLDQAKFPTRGSYESVTADQIQQLDDMLALIESGYKGLLSGGEQSQAPTQQPQEFEVNGFKVRRVR